MNLLKQFQNNDDIALTQKFAELTNSIQSAFNGETCRHSNAERFEYILNGLCSVVVRLNLSEGTIQIGISTDHILSYEDGSACESKAGVDPKKLKAFVSKSIKLESKKWELQLQKYYHVHFSQVVSELSSDVLSDLVKLMERTGFVPRVEMKQRYF